MSCGRRSPLPGPPRKRLCFRRNRVYERPLSEIEPHCGFEETDVLLTARLLGTSTGGHPV